MPSVEREVDHRPAAAVRAARVEREVSRWMWRRLPAELRVKLRREYRRIREMDRRFMEPSNLAARARCEAYRNGMIDALDYRA